jgi:hypothetical protein
VECKEASVEAVADDPDTATDETVVAKAGKWETEKEYYWPGDAKDLRFFAVAADGDWLRPTAPGECPVEINYEAPSLKIKDFIVRNTAANGKTAANEDLMVADFVKQNQSEKEVDLTFRHTLAKVEFVFKTLAPEANSTAPDVWVQSLSMGNLKNKGTLDVIAKSGETDVVWEYDWTPDQTATAVTFTISSTELSKSMKCIGLFSPIWIGPIISTSEVRA